jgi:hypothetical protein
MDDVTDRPPLSRWSRAAKKTFNSRRIIGTVFGGTIGRSRALRSLLHIYPSIGDPAAIARARIVDREPAVSTIALEPHIDDFLRQYRDALRECYAPGELRLRYDVDVFEMADCDVLPWINLTVHRPSASIVQGRPRSHKMTIAPRIRRIAGSALAAGDMPSGFTNYYHFFEGLALALRALRAIPGPERVALLFSDTAPAYQRKILEAIVARYPQLYIEYVARREIARPDRLFQVFARARHPICRFAMRQEWREIGAITRECYGIGPSEQTRSVYFSRKRQETRRLVNEAALLPVFAKHGFEILSPETLPHEDQVRMMTQTRRLAGVEGAALINILFADKPIDMLEIFPQGAAYPFYVALALQLGHRYRVVMSNPAGLNDAITLDPAALDRALQQIA